MHPSHEDPVQKKEKQKRVLKSTQMRRQNKQRNKKGTGNCDGEAGTACAEPASPSPPRQPQSDQPYMSDIDSEGDKEMTDINSEELRK